MLLKAPCVMKNTPDINRVLGDFKKHHMKTRVLSLPAIGRKFAAYGFADDTRNIRARVLQLQKVESPLVKGVVGSLR